MSEENISVKTLVTEDMTREELYYYAKNLEEREAELLNINNKLQEEKEHYKHLYGEVKKQKDDVVEYIKKHFQDDEGILCKDVGDNTCEINENFIDNLLRMLGEIDVED